LIVSALRGFRELKVQIEKLYSRSKTSGFKVTFEGKAPFFLKVFHHPLNFKRLLTGFFLTRPQREFKFSSVLRKKGFPVPEVVSFRLKKIWGVLPVNVGCTKSVYLEGLIPLDKLLGSGDFEVYFEEAITLLARLHREGFIHRDASLSNFALYRGEVYLIDLEGIVEVFPLLPFSRFRNFLNFINDVLKHGYKVNPEKVLELYLKEFRFPFGRKYLSSKLSALLRRRGVEGFNNSA